MKIGIINLVIDTNYGGNLQRFALCSTLKKLGHEVVYIPTIAQFNIPSGIIAILTYIKRAVFEFFGNKKRLVFYEKELSKEYNYQITGILDFINRNVTCYSKVFNEFEDMSELNNMGFDAFIVGSDQIWRSSPGRNIEHFYLDFIVNPNIKKIAYAASFGDNGNSYTKEQIIRCGELIGCFTSVSVRESSALSVIDRFGWGIPRTPKVVLDPTLLLTKDEYCGMIANIETFAGNQLFCYVLDMNEQIHKVINQFSDKYSLATTIVDSILPNFGKPDIQVRIPSIEQWIRYYKDSEYVITDSFHGTMFSIIFNKPFVTFLNKRRGSERYTPILDLLGLSDRLIDMETIDISIDSLNPIDWTLVNTRLANLRQDSISFITDSLKL